MRHRKKTVKLGRTAEHRNALLANQACSLIEHGRIKTTLAKAKAVRPLAEKMVTLAKRGSLHARRRALALLHNNSTRTVKAVGKLFAEIAPRSANRNGGYTRVVKLGPRPSDSAPMAFIEWVDLIAVEEPTSKPDKKSSKKTSKTPAAEEDKATKA
jgi:large subunit ribosomal protein L17